MRLGLDIDDDAAVRRLEGLENRSRDPRPALRRAGEILERGLRRQFDSKGGHFGDPWPALADATVEWKAGQGLSPEILHAAGDLEASLTRGRDGRVSATEVSAGTTDPAAIFHQAGTRSGLPARPVVGVSRRDRREVVDLVRGYLLRGMTR